MADRTTIPAPGVATRLPARALRACWALDRVLRVSGALVGSFPVAILVAGALAAHLPLPANVRFPLCLLLVVPLWVAGMCAGFLVPRGWQVWLVVAIVVVGLTVLVPDASLLSPPAR
jgi:hypothetical protein